MRKILGLSIAVVLSEVLITPAALGQGQAQMPAQPMSFFITSTPIGDGANLGGLAGADAHCQKLAAAAGSGNKTWRAYLSTSQAGATPAVNARARIGDGPWYNAKGELIAANVADLHGDQQRDRNNIRKPNALNEKGGMVNGVGDMPNQHDMLTGSDSGGRAVIGAAAVTTCGNWTSNSTGNAIVGHHDRLGGGNSSWNAAHSSAACSQEALVKTGGAGLFYCFAAN
ncbi:MAG: lectin [Vicinamibacterales bacterium]